MSIFSYKTADETFNIRGPVRSNAWAANERPLVRTDKHKRIMHNAEHDYYDVILYRTTLARFYKPVIDDMGVKRERRLYMGHSSNTSRNFMWEFLGHGGSLPSWITHADEGADHIVPVYTKGFMQDDRTNFSADLLFVDDKLDFGSSKHTPHYRKVSSKQDKANRADVLRRMDNYITLAAMRLPEFIAEANINGRLGRPFGGEGYNHSYANAVKDLESGSPELVMSHILEDFFAMCQGVVNSLASKRGYKQEGFSVGSYWSMSANADSISKLEKPIEADEFRRAVQDRILKYTSANHRSDKKEIPQFPTRKDYPRSNVFL